MKNPTTTPDLDALLEHGGWVRALARSLVRDPDLADDVEQQTWLTAMQHPPAHGKNLRAWLGTVVRSVAGGQWRADKARQRRESVVGERQVAREVQKASRAQPDSLAERMDTFRQLAGAMAELEEPYGTTLYLRFFEELPVREVARRMQVPEATAQTRITRGLKMLRARVATTLGSDWRQRCMVFTLPLAKASWLVPAAVIAMTMKTKMFLTAACVALLSLFVWQPWASGGAIVPEDEDGLQAAVLEHREMEPASGVEEAPVIARADLVLEEVGAGSAIPEPTEETLVIRVRDAVTLDPAAGAEILFYDYREREKEWNNASRWEFLDEEQLLERFGTKTIADEFGVLRMAYPPGKAVMAARMEGKFSHYFLHPDFHPVGEDVELLLRPERSQEVKVVDQQGAPVQGLNVGFSAEPPSRAGFSRRKVVTDAEGRATLRHLELHLREDLQNWSNTVAVQMPTPIPQVQELRNEEIGQEVLQFVVPPRGLVEVHCRHEDGTILENGIPISLIASDKSVEFRPWMRLGNQTAYVREGVATFPLVGIGCELSAGTSVRGGSSYVSVDAVGPGRAGETVRIDLILPSPSPKLRMHLTGQGMTYLKEGWMAVKFDYLDPATGETSGIGSSAYLAEDGWMEIDAGVALEKDAPLTRITIDARSGSATAIGTMAFAALDFDVDRFREDKEPLEVTFGEATIVAGKVVDEQGFPVAGHALTLRVRDRRIPIGEMGSLLDYQEVQTAEDGSFRFMGPTEHPNFFYTLHLPHPRGANWGVEEQTPFREGQEDLVIVVPTTRRIVGKVLVDDMEWTKELAVYARTPTNANGTFSHIPIPLEVPNGRFVIENLETEGLTLELRQVNGGEILASQSMSQESLQQRDGETVLPDWDVRGILTVHRIEIGTADGADPESIRASSDMGSVFRSRLIEGEMLLFSTQTVLDLEVWAKGYRTSMVQSNGTAEVELTGGFPARFHLPKGLVIPEGTFWGVHLYSPNRGPSKRSVETIFLRHDSEGFPLVLPHPGDWFLVITLNRDEEIESRDGEDWFMQPVLFGSDAESFEFELHDTTGEQGFTIPLTAEDLAAARAAAR